MITKLIKVLGVFAVIAVLAVSILALGQTGTVYASTLDRRGPGGSGGGYGQGGAAASAPAAGYAATPLSAEEKDALSQAILEEYGALNLYKSVINQFGSVAPFAQIVRAEQNHVNALLQQAAKYGVTAPANPGLSGLPSFNSLSAAYQAGADAEIADAALYDTLKPVVTHTDLLQVFNNLQRASLNSHLPAFQAYQ